jgi:hypothetical protein
MVMVTKSEIGVFAVQGFLRPTSTHDTEQKAEAKSFEVETEDENWPQQHHHHTLATAS